MKELSSVSSPVIPDRNLQGALPHHVAVIMDGNGRWAMQQGLPRTAGHKKGVDAVREIVKHCRHHGIGYLTLFAFSNENWSRPQQEIRVLTDLLCASIDTEARLLIDNDIKL
ncbi:MAG: undecaprenyl diphosphate synthase family protein, partial [Gammaproteobacteria bacterium]|nr:undecaprenyl diphosphate synthase family protein [Gammaproteobacteria bacterium]